MDSRKKNNLSQQLLALFSNLRWVFKGIKVFSLVGKSGTGKSFRAKLVAKKYNIDIILDDGLVIYNNKIIAGKTAKKEKYYLQAVKVALYDDPSHRQEVIYALENVKFKKILILGTSDKMIKKIILHLNLPDVFRTIRIEDISSSEEREAALKNRSEGKHVIPAPGIEVQRNNSHIFYDSIKIFLDQDNRWTFGKKRKKNAMVEKTIVRPQFKDGDKGQLMISEAALNQMVIHCMQEFDSSFKPLKVKVRLDRKNAYVIKLIISAPYKSALATKIHELQRYIIENIETYTGLLLKEVHITISKLTEEKGIKK